MLLHSCVSDKWHSVGEKCFSCQLSLLKRQGTKFSHTEWGAGYESGYQMSHSVMWFSFCFLAIRSNTFSTLPAPCQSVSEFFFQCELTLFALSVIFVELWSCQVVNEYCCILLWQTNGIQCVRTDAAATSALPTVNLGKESFLFATALVAYITVMIIHLFILSSAVQMYEFPYIHFHVINHAVDF